jgi:hypothetical protein
MKRIILILFFCLFSLAQPLWAYEPPALEKPDAQAVLDAMGWTEVTIVAIRQGVDCKGAIAPIYATVIGMGKYCDQHRTINQTLYYDKDLGWHYLELREKSACVWTRNGFQEIKPWALW